MMTINFGLLLSSQRRNRADDTWERIQDNGASIVFTRPKVVTKTGTTPAATLPAQIVRIEPDNRESVAEGQAGVAPVLKATVYGIVNHRTLPDTDMDEGYEFDYQGDHYRCINVKLVPSAHPVEKQGTFIING